MYPLPLVNVIFHDQDEGARPLERCVGLGADQTHSLPIALAPPMSDLCRVCSVVENKRSHCAQHRVKGQALPSLIVGESQMMQAIRQHPPGVGGWTGSAAIRRAEEKVISNRAPGFAGISLPDIHLSCEESRSDGDTGGVLVIWTKSEQVSARRVSSTALGR